MRVVLVPGERLQMVERTPVLDDRGEPHLIGEEALLGAGDQVVEHVLHPAPPAEVEEAAGELQLAVEPGPDEEDDEVTLDLGGHPPAGHFGHRTPAIPLCAP
jgi:hypothetical protein